MGVTTGIQLGAYPTDTIRPVIDPRANYRRVKLGDPKGANPDEWPEDLRIREFPTVAR